jgi:hypothetical protein
MPVGTVMRNPIVAAQIGITMESGSRLRVDVHDRDGTCFKEVRCSGGIAYIGYGSNLFVVHTGTRSCDTHGLDGYFGHLYTAEELGATSGAFAVLAASASELLSFAPDGLLYWRTSRLGIDGVVVQSVLDGLVHGSGEWDPPGGWRPFCLDVDSGRRHAG